MSLYEKLVNKETTMSIVGLGYVGLPIAIAFAKKLNVIGFDINIEKISKYKLGVDPTNEVGNEEIKLTKLIFTTDERQISIAKFHIIAVPTPINKDKTPDLNPVEESSKIVGRNLTKGSIVVYESTVYPGVTEDICIPILEKESKLKCGIDFYVGYSPERINPGDKIHTLENIVKIVSAQDKETLNEISKVYELIIKAGIHKASSIKVAEAAKVVENSQRDINIAFMNELAMVFNLMKVDTKEVIDAMNTKWNALRFTPGLVGGHCIGIDPYYFIYEAEKLGYHSQIVLGGRKINDGMGKFIVDNIIKKIIKSDLIASNIKVSILGLTFKENVPDIRNSKVFDIIRELKNFGIHPVVHDPFADEKDVFNECGINLSSFEGIYNSDILIFSVPHEFYKKMSIKQINELYKSPNKKILIDIKSIFNLDELKKENFDFWRL